MPRPAAAAPGQVGAACSRPAHARPLFTLEAEVASASCGDSRDASVLEQASRQARKRAPFKLSDLFAARVRRGQWRLLCLRASAVAALAALAASAVTASNPSRPSRVHRDVAAVPCVTSLHCDAPPCAGLWTGRVACVCHLLRKQSAFGSHNSMQLDAHHQRLVSRPKSKVSVQSDATSSRFLMEPSRVRYALRHANQAPRPRNRARGPRARRPGGPLSSITASRPPRLAMDPRWR